MKTRLFSQSDSFDSTESETETLIDPEYNVPPKPTHEDEAKHMVSQSSPQRNDESPANDEYVEQAQHEYSFKSIKNIISKFESNPH